MVLSGWRMTTGHPPGSALMYEEQLMTANDGMVRIRFTQNGVDCVTEPALFLEDVLPIFMAGAPVANHHFETYKMCIRDRNRTGAHRIWESAKPRC